MTQNPLGAPGGYGAVDLSALARRPAAGPTNGTVGATTPAAGGAGTAPGGGAARPGLVQEVTEATFTAAINATLRVPAILVVVSSANPQTLSAVDVIASVVAGLDGRFQVLSLDADTNPGLVQALQIQAVPTSFGIIKGQPMPLFTGIPAEAEVRSVCEELTKVAVQYGVTGRVETAGQGDEDAADEAATAPTNPLHEKAYDAIEAGDLDGAAAAYREALAADPGDTDAELGLAQVGLLRRTEGVDLATARAAAAADPADLEAAFTVADLDVLGGHVEDAFARLVDLVRQTAGDDRDRVRTHLLELMGVVGAHDDRVRRARTALMSALF